MNSYALSHLADHVLLRNLASLVAQDRTTTAALLAHLAEVDSRKLYLPAAYPSMYHYCVGELRLSEDAAFRRIRAARTARQFPEIFAALAGGRLGLSTVLTLTPYLTPENAHELLAAAEHKTKAELELQLAERFPRPDVATRVLALAPGSATGLLVAEAADSSDSLAPAPVQAFAMPLAPAPVSALPDQLVSEPVAPRAKLAPLSAERFALQVTIGKATHDKLRYAQALLGHAVPSSEVAQVLDRALDALIQQLEKRRFAAGSQSRPGRRPSQRDRRYIPAGMRRTVWLRDHGQCTFVSEQGHRCPARTRLEFDHVTPFARGGLATAQGLRLRCRAHNQYAAECAFGAGFMAHKRTEAGRSAARARTPKGQAATNRPAADQEVIPWLRALGFRADEARRGAALAAAIGHAPLEQRVRLAISSLAPGSARKAPGNLASGPA